MAWETVEFERLGEVIESYCSALRVVDPLRPATVFSALYPSVMYLTLVCIWMLRQGRAFRTWSIGRWLEGRHPDSLEWVVPGLGPDGTFSFL